MHNAFDCDNKIEKKAVAVFFKFFSLINMIAVVCVGVVVFLVERFAFRSFTAVYPKHVIAHKHMHKLNVCSNAEDKTGTIDINNVHEVRKTDERRKNQ